MIPYRTESFTPVWGPNLQGFKNLSVDWRDLVKAAITVGKPGVGYMLPHGWHSISDIISRTWLVYANLRGTPIGFEKSSLYEAQDPTEKGGTSYFLGMISAKLVAEHLLDAPWVMHVSMFKAGGGVLRLGSKSKPDLIGRNRSGDWIVLEAKGRTGAFSKQAMDKAKSQTRQLRQINGKYPVLRAGVQAYFMPQLELRIVDPEEYDNEAEDFEGNFDLAARRYYSSALSSIREYDERRQISEREFLIRYIEEVGVTIGIDRKVREILIGDEEVEGRLLQAIEGFDRADSLQGTTGERAYGDGLYIGLDDRWSAEAMLADPSSRGLLT